MPAHSLGRSGIEYNPTAILHNIIIYPLMKINNIRKSSLLLFMFLMLSVPMLQAQDPGAPDDGDGTNIPIDGGISLLLAVGAIYGGKKLHQLKKTNVTDSDRGAK